MRHVRAAFIAITLLSAFGCGGGSGEDLVGPKFEGPDGSFVDDGSVEDTGDSGFVLDTNGCTPKTCAELGVNCGPSADGCGGIIETCGTCAAPEFCGGGGASKCGLGDAGACTPKTCVELGASCGKQGDGCGALIDCGACVAPDTCGGGGVPSKCGRGGTGSDGGACVPKTCAAMGYDCGPVADGCAGLVNCGTCPSGTICGAASKPNVCGVAPPAPCTKKTCADVGANCGPVSDGCGGLTPSCGTCTGTETCGGGGVSSKCGGAPACVKKTCTDYPGTCGQQPDGCGGLTVSCGSCTAPETCGGGGVASKCGGAPTCVRKTCADYPGTCGQQSDGCGGLTVSCGSCVAPQTCGGGGVPNKCGAPPPCAKKTCADYPGTCGPQIDGCGGVTVSCGTCTSPAYCGGGGPGKCGTGGSTTCVNLACKQTTCSGTATTSISGVVYDPAGLRPLPNVNVYVPNGTVAPLTSGATCDGCSAGLSGFPLVKTVTDIRGAFRLTNMPVDTNVPVVIQVGKWRRQIRVTTSSCANVVVPAGLTRLPRNKTEGDIPKIALVTGNADTLECLLRKIGIDDSEFTNPTGTGRVNLYAGSGGTSTYSAGGTFPTATQLWNSNNPNTLVTPPIYGLKAYDVVLLSCEGSEATTNKSNVALQAMQDYANSGGRVFGSHYHFTWMKRSSALVSPYNRWSTLVTWNSTSSGLTSPTQETVLTSFPKALTMNQWMQVTPPPPATPWATVVPPAPSPSRFPVNNGRSSISSINDTTNVLRWIQTVSGAIPQYFSYDTPVGAAAGAACGRFVFSDLHVGSSSDLSNRAFPTQGCLSSKTSMTAQEGALEFMFFDPASPVCGGTTPPPTCTPTTCAAQGIECGSAPDGCGGTISSCGTCAPPAVCSTGGKCSSTSCMPTTCTALGYDCGSWADGCGGTLNCGPCTTGTCGGGGVAGKCGGPTCAPTTCSTLGYDCGLWPNGCGGTLDCGVCVAPASCGGGGVAGKCGSPMCTPATCAALGYECGSWADGCGGVLNCGVCVAPATCGASTPGKCDKSSCVPKTCTDLGVKCGPSGDGCGGTIDCGACPPGGGCTPLTCGGRCGPQGDGCGGVLMCTPCPGGTCVPTTCAAAGADCGAYPDGCGGLLMCGTCIAPQTCGGSGVANKCGGVK